MLKSTLHCQAVMQPMVLKSTLKFFRSLKSAVKPWTVSFTHTPNTKKYVARASRKWEWSRTICGDAQTDAHGALNADGAAKNLSEAGGAIEHTDNGISQPSHDQVAYVAKIMGDYRKEDWLDDEEKWKHELAKQTLEARWHEIEMIEQLGASAIEHPKSSSSGA